MVNEENKPNVKIVPIDANAIFDDEVLKHLNISDEEADCVEVCIQLEKGKYGNYISIWKKGE